MSRPGNGENRNFMALFDLIGELARRRYQAGERAFATLGLNHTEARLLGLLGQEGGSATQENLSSKLTVDRSNAVRALQRLQVAGYVTRSRDEEDKRANLVRITPQGRKTVAEIGKLRNRMAETFFGDLQSDEAGTVVELLRKAVPR